MKPLYKIAGEWKAILDYAQEEDIDEQAILDTLESLDLTEDLAQKVENYWHVIDELEASNERIKKEIDRLQGRRRTQSNNIKKLKDTLTDVLDYLDVPKIKTDTSTIWIQNNPHGLEIRDISKIPKRFFTEQEPKLNSRELINYLKENPDEDFGGAELRQTRGIRRR